MKTQIFAFVTVFALAVLGSGDLLAQSDPFIGTWKQDMAKSKYAAGAPVALSRTITYESQGDQIKSTHDAVRTDGTHVTWTYTGKFDGKDNPITWTGAQNPADQTDAISVKRPTANTYEAAQKKAGKILTTARAVVSNDGKTMTITQKFTNANGQPVTNVTVYDKQ